jgi:peroxiredoxin
MGLLNEGSLAPDFELSTADGVRMRLSEVVRSGPVALAFYKGSCPTSQFTFPFLQSIFREVGQAAEPRIWGISQDEASETRQFIAEYALEFPVLVDEHPYPVSDAYQLEFVPTLYLIDGDRRVQVASFGFSKPALRAIARQFAEVLGLPEPEIFPEDDGLPERRPG